KLALASLLMNVILAIALTKLFKVSYDKVIISTMISYLLMVVLLSYFGRKSLQLKIDLKSLVQDIFPFNIFIPYFSSLVLILGDFNNQYYIIPLLLFLILNFKSFAAMKIVIIEII